MYVWDRAQCAPPHDLAFQAGEVGSMRRNSGFDAPRTTAYLLVWSGSVPNILAHFLSYRCLKLKMTPCLVEETLDFGLL